jgi:hypothetical protein
MQSVDFAESSLEAPMGSGPYELADVDPGQIRHLPAPAMITGPRTCR